MPMFTECVVNELLECFSINVCFMMMVLLQTELLSSLVLSMLQQILNDDKADGVRQAAAKSLAVLVAFIDDKAKFQNVCNNYTFGCVIVTPLP